MWGQPPPAVRPPWAHPSFTLYGSEMPLYSRSVSPANTSV